MILLKFGIQQNKQCKTQKLYDMYMQRYLTRQVISTINCICCEKEKYKLYIIDLGHFLFKLFLYYMLSVLA